jgi:D-alanyl-D-alanine carboxypeptidase/D-alanyl-D-alanine-endopeptidase (penicillin-binding protein 4)
LRRRFVGQPVEARLKTGSLNDVRALAGYVKALNGQRYALVVLVNSPRASELTPALDALVARLISQPGKLEASE